MGSGLTTCDNELIPGIGGFEWTFIIMAFTDE
jgi:hypothetical protein